MKKGLLVRVIGVISLIGMATVSLAAGESLPIGTAATAALTEASPYFVAAGAAALGLWGARMPIGLGLGFLKRIFK